MKNTSEQSIQAIFHDRWSPYAFDTSKPVDPQDLSSLFEAARWAMSAYNEQPWRYIVANRNTDPTLWKDVLASLVEGNRSWAQHVPVLALGFVTPEFEKTGKPNDIAIHDLGAASAFLTIEATARGLAVHQMSGILPDVIGLNFPSAKSLQPVTGLAIGYAGPNDQLDENIAMRDTRTRERKPLSDILLQASL
jgi:nitroreductase